MHTENNRQQQGKITKAEFSVHEAQPQVISKHELRSEHEVSCVGLEQQARQLQHEQEKIRGNDYPDMLEEMVRYIGADIDSVEVKLENTLKDVTGLPGMQLLNAFQQGSMEHSTQIDTVFAQLDKRFEWCVTQQIQAQQQAVQLERQRQVQLERKKAEQRRSCGSEERGSCRC